MSPNMSAPTQQPIAKTVTTTPSISSVNGQRNLAQFKGSKSLRPNGRNRFNKRKRSGGAPRQDSAPSRAPLNAYLSVCCGLPARKPQTGRKDKVQSPENGKTKEQAKGLGKWRCSQCGKPTKVTVSRAGPTVPAPQVETVVVTNTEVAIEAPIA